jgi:hypothetical protein
MNLSIVVSVISKYHVSLAPSIDLFAPFIPVINTSTAANVVEISGPLNTDKYFC